MKHFLLIYDYVPDYLERRGALRQAHLSHARGALDRGELFLAGACVDEGTPIGVLVFKAANRQVVEEFARHDPYVQQGLAAAWRVREWTTVIGRDAIAPVTF
jgi:uncharacterized protein YciI